MTEDVQHEDESEPVTANSEDFAEWVKESGQLLERAADRDVGWARAVQENAELSERLMQLSGSSNRLIEEAGAALARAWEGAPGTSWDQFQEVAAALARGRPALIT